MHVCAAVGDLVYYPPNWGHETKALGPINVAVSNSIVDILFAHRTAEDLRNNQFTLFVMFVCQTMFMNYTYLVDYMNEYWMLLEYAQRHTPSFNFSPDLCNYVYQIYKEGDK